ncbi:MAG: hypothetical protein ACYSUI_13070 [Planctomycetota bacterium]|jgi:hypothetical protein
MTAANDHVGVLDTGPLSCFVAQAGGRHRQIEHADDGGTSRPTGGRALAGDRDLPGQAPVSVGRPGQRNHGRLTGHGIHDFRRIARGQD